MEAELRDAMSTISKKDAQLERLREHMIVQENANTQDALAREEVHAQSTLI